MEWFCCLHGKCSIVTTNVWSKQQRNIVMDDSNKEFVIINPYEAHVVLNLSDKECELLVISSSEYDPDNTDTIEYKVKG
jgi:UDP-2-acetamido-2,6-beta-L-arabino-hexul-4-ose reductase